MLDVLMSLIVKELNYIIIFGSLLVLRAGGMDINDFFPDIKGNLTMITWAHAVNNRTHLNEALKSPVMMLEADIIYGKINGTGESMPIMGHPPANQSDLSLEEFLQTTYSFNKDEKNQKVRKGVKLDFKSTEVFLKSVPIIKKIYSMVDYPLWLNADIFSGPLNASTLPVDPDDFLSGSAPFPAATLSLGWTTTPPTPATVYTDAQISRMTAALQRHDVRRPVTFAVRAGIAALSPSQMRTLRALPNTTLTVWSGVGDVVDVEALRDVVLDHGVDRVFVDVPQELRDRLHLNAAATPAALTLLALGSALATSLLK